MNARLTIIIALFLLTPTVFLYAQTNPTARTLPYSQDFSSLLHSSDVYPDGWQGWTISTSPGSSFNASTPTADTYLTPSSSASTTSGNIHNYDGKIGFLNSGSLDLSIILAISTSSLYNAEVTYDIMTLRNPYNGGTNTRINEVTLQYRIGTSGVFTNLTTIEYSNTTTTQITLGVTIPQNLETKQIILPAVCDNQSVVQLRWVSREISGSGSRPSFALDNISVESLGENTLSDYYRSCTSGLWNDPTSWECSADMLKWIRATSLFPDYQANTISIQNGNTININADIAIDQVVVEDGAVLNYNSAVINVNNGPGYDICIEEGGTFLLSKTSTGVISFATNATFQIQEGGLFQCNVSSGPAANYANSNGSVSFQQSMIWEHGSVFLWNTTSTFSASGTTYFPQVNSSTAPIFRVNTMTSAPGASNTLTINGILEANSDFSLQGSGTKIIRNGFRGSGQLQQSMDCGIWQVSGTNAVLGGSGKITLSTNGMQINAGCTLSLTSDKTVENGLLTHNGVIDLINHTLSLGYSGSLTGSGEIIVSGNQDGKISASHSFSNTLLTNENIGNLGAEISIPNTYTGDITVFRGHKQQTGNSHAGINRYFDIITSGANSSLNATLIFHYIESELDGQDESLLRLFKSTDNGLKWSMIPTVCQPAANTLTVNGIDGFSRCTASEETSPLPVKLLYFLANRNNQMVEIEWATATELNNAGFIIERSTNAKEFENLGFVAGAGNSNRLITYTFTDYSPLLWPMYYRLKQIDNNGGHEYSQLVVVGPELLCSGSITKVSLNNGRLSFLRSSSEQIQVQILDITGRVVFPITLISGDYQQLEIPLPDLCKGVYFVRFFHDNKIENMKLIHK